MSSIARVILVGFAATALASSSLRADFLTIPEPTPGYLAGTTLLNFTDPDTTLIGGLSGSGETLIYSSNLVEYTVPTSWSGWGTPPTVESSTPRVGYTNGASSLVINLLGPATTFGVEIEPDNLAREATDAAFFSGSTLVGNIDLSPDGKSGALLYAASTTTNPFTSVVITNLVGDDFAIAEQRFTLADPTPTPEPADSALFGSGLLGVFLLWRTLRLSPR